MEDAYWKHNMWCNCAWTITDNYRCRCISKVLGVDVLACNCYSSGSKGGDGGGSDHNSLKLLVIRIFGSGSGWHLQQLQEFEDSSLAVGELGSACWFIHPSHWCDEEPWHELFSFSFLDIETIPCGPSASTFSETAVATGMTLYHQ